MKRKVYVTRRIPQTGIDLLKRWYEVKVFAENSPIDRDTLIHEVKDTEGLVSVLSDGIDEEVFHSASKLKVVANYAVGYNNVDIKAAQRHGVMVTNTPGVLTNATAEIAFALLITLTRKILEADSFTREGKFQGWNPLLFLGDELKGKTLGVIGMGRIGEDMAFKCRAFGMNIVYHNRKPREDETQSALSATYCTLDELFSQSHVISLHTPLSEDTYHLINEEAFRRMRDGVYLINTSRGEVIEEKALIRELQSGKVKGAGFDVYEFEPRIPEELMGMKNVVLLPHIGSATVETRERMSEMVAENVVAALEGRRPPNLVLEMESLFD